MAKWTSEKNEGVMTSQMCGAKSFWAKSTQQ